MTELLDEEYKVSVYSFRVIALRYLGIDEIKNDIINLMSMTY